MGSAASIYRQRSRLSALYRGDAGADSIPDLGMASDACASMAPTPTLAARRASTPRARLGTNLMQNQGSEPGIALALRAGAGQRKPVSAGDAGHQQPADQRQDRLVHERAPGAMARASTPTWRRGRWRKPPTRSWRRTTPGGRQQQQSILEGGQQRAGQWAQLMPTLDEARYAPAQDAGRRSGNFYQERAQTALDDQIKTVQRPASLPVGTAGALQRHCWAALARWAAPRPAPPPPRSISPRPCRRLLGGGLAGAGIGGSFGGPPGAGVGALGGGLLGMM